MNIQTTRINAANASAKGSIPSQDLERKIDQVAQKASKTIKMAGFRQGKVPVNIVKTRYKDSIRKDAQQEIVQEILNTAIKDLKIDTKTLIGDPIITKFDEKPEEIDIEIKISIIPEFSLDAIEDKVPQPQIPKPSQKDIDERLQTIANAQAPLKESKDKILKQNHTANIDFEGFIDGVAFDGGKAQGFDLTIGSNQFIPGFEEALIGAKLGEEKEIEVTFPTNYHSSALAGKKATFKVKINKIQEKEKVQLDDAFAKKLLGKEDATLDELKNNIKLELENELKSKYYNDEMKDKCLEAFNKAFDFDLPDLIVEQEIDVLFRNELSKMTQDELKTYQEDAKKAQEKRESFRQDAQKSVRVTFIIDAIAKKRGINVSDNEVMSAIYYEAMMSGQNPKEVLEFYKNNNYLPAIKMAMIEDRVLQTLLDEKAGIQKVESKEPKPKSTKSTKSSTTTKDSAAKKTSKPKDK